MDIVCEKDLTIEVLGCDGTAVNTGENNGALRIVELDIDKPLQHFVCLLHTNELSFWHLFSALEGGTTGPNSFDGPIGKAATEDVWKRPLSVLKPWKERPQKYQIKLWRACHVTKNSFIF